MIYAMLCVNQEGWHDKEMALTRVLSKGFSKIMVK